MVCFIFGLCCMFPIGSCKIVCVLICLLVYFLCLYVYLPACLTFYSLFLLYLIVFFAQINQIYICCLFACYAWWHFLVLDNFRSFFIRFFCAADRYSYVFLFNLLCFAFLLTLLCCCYLVSC